MKWEGIQRGSIDVGASNEALEVVNGRFVTTGELRRRRGMARTNIIKKGASIGTLSGFSAFQSNVMCALTDADRIQGYQQPAALWGDSPGYRYPTASIPTWGYTFDNTQDDLDGANPFALTSTVYSTWDGEEPDGWFQAGTSDDTSIVTVADTGEQCTFAVGVYGDTALGNKGKYLDIDTVRFRIRLSLYDVLELFDAADTLIYAVPFITAAYKHVAFISDGTTLRAYIDGVRVYSGAEPAHAAIPSAEILATANTYGTVGLCDLFAWNYELSEDQLADIITDRSDRPW
jgi:hypothetical protein